MLIVRSWEKIELLQETNKELLEIQDGDLFIEAASQEPFKKKKKTNSLEDEGSLNTLNLTVFVIICV